MKQIDKAGMTFDSSTRLVCDTSQLQFPAPVRKHDGDDVRLVLSMNPDSEGSSEPHFMLPDRHRNVVSVTMDCELEWIVKSAAEVMVPGDWHWYVWLFDKRVLTKTKEEGRFFEIDTVDGTVADHWPADMFVIDDVRHRLEDGVNSVDQLRGKTLLNVSHDFVYCFSEDGEQLWKLDLPGGNFWRLATSEDRVRLGYLKGRGQRVDLAIDVETGDVLEYISGSRSIAGKIKRQN